jgi:putative FmdB family regulatory protein
MPVYPLVCQTCKHRWETFHHMTEPHPECPECGSETAETDLHAASPKNNMRAWDVREGTSVSLYFDPEKLPELTRDVPDLKLNSAGAVVYDNDAHQRKVKKQMRDALERERARDRERQEQRREQEARG